MGSGEIDLIPGRQLGETERVTNAKLNDLGRPVLRIKEFAVTAREMADGTITSDKLDSNISGQLGVPDGSVTTNKMVDGAVTTSKLAVDARVPVGVMIDFAGTTAPTGWLMCYGQAIPRGTFADLFTAIGITYGAGDGTTTFNLPDCRGRVAAGKDNMGGSSANRLTTPVNGDVLGEAGGLETHTLTIAELANHAHTINDPTHAHNTLSPVVRNLFPTVTSFGMTAAGNLDPNNVATTDPRSIGITINASGSGASHANVQPTIIFNKIIKY